MLVQHGANSPVRGVEKKRLIEHETKTNKQTKKKSAKNNKSIPGMLSTRLIFAKVSVRTEHGVARFIAVDFREGD